MNIIQIIYTLLDKDCIFNNTKKLDYNIIITKFNKLVINKL
jgi:hypothetical protein